MQKNILLSLLMITLFSGLYGCSCSKSPTEDPDVAPGLYIADFAFEEGDEEHEVKLNLRLQRVGSDDNTVTVDFEIKASNSSDKENAVVGDGSNADVRGTPDQNTITFSGSTSDTLTIPIILVGDTLYELDKVFTVELVNASGANIVEGIAEITILNDDQQPTASLELVDVNEGLILKEETPRRIEMRVSLNVVSGVDATLEILRSAESFVDKEKHGLVGAYRIDYKLYQSDEILPAAAELVILAGEIETIIDVEVIDDGIPENLEKFDISVAGKSHVSVSNSAVLSYEIEDNDSGSFVAKELNDTGILEYPGIFISEELKAQVDLKYGRDNRVGEEPKVGGGIAAFDFSKISSTGEVMADDADYEITPWDCVRDNTTGLLWEVKVPGEAVERGGGRNYFWYDSNYSTNGGDRGRTARYQCELTDTDVNAGSACNTAYYVADINSNNKICGMTGWRMPTIEELRSILDYGADGVHYDTNYFAGDKIGAKFIWSSTTVASNPSRAWAIRFGELSEEARSKSSSGINGIRLVNSREIQ